MSIVRRTQCFLITSVALMLAAVAAPVAAQSKSVAGHPLKLDTIVLKPLPSDAIALNSRLSARLNPAVAAWIQSEGRALAGRGLAADALLATIRTDVTGRFAGQALGASDVETLVMLVLMQANLAAQADLRALMTELKASVVNSQALRTNAAAAKDDALSDLSQEQSLRLQLRMDRWSKMLAMLSSIMQRYHAMNESIISNLK